MRTALLLFLPFFSLSQSLETVVQKGHELPVISVAVSPDSNYVVTGSRDKSAKLWQLSTGREVRSFLGHDLTVTSMQFSRDGKVLLTGSNDGTVRFWEVATGKELYAFNPSREKVAYVRFSTDMKYFVLSLAMDQYYNNQSLMPEAVQIYDTETKKLVTTLKIDKLHHKGAHIDFSPDGKWLAAGLDGQLAEVYSTTDWKVVRSFKDETGRCLGCATWVAFTPNSKELIVASTSSSTGSLKKYDLGSGSMVIKYLDGPDNVTSLKVSPDGRTILLSTESEITLWDAASGTEILRFTPASSSINECAFLPNGRQILVASGDNTAIVWDLAKRKAIRLLTGFLNQRVAGFTWDRARMDTEVAKHVRFKGTPLITPDGKSLIKGKFGTKVKKWSIETGRPEAEFAPHPNGGLCYDQTRDGKKVVTGGGDGKIRIWDTKSGDSLRVIRAHTDAIIDIRLNSDESQVAALGGDASLSVWDMATGEEINRLWLNQTQGIHEPGYNLLWGTSDLYFFVGSYKNLRLWEMDSRSIVRDFVGHQDYISSLQLSSDQQQLLSASWDGSIRLWSVGTGLMQKKYTGHHGPVHSAIFSPDGKTIYSAGADRQIRVWDINTAKVINTFDGHKAEVASLQFSPNGQMLVSYSVDGVTKFWDLRTGKEFFEHIHFGEHEWMVKNPEGYFSGTEEARKYIHFVEGIKTYSVDQFFDEFYRPDLLPKIFQNRGGNDMKGIKGALQKSPPPGVKLATITSEAGKADLYLQITDNGAGAEYVKVFHNGKSLALGNDLKLPSGKGQSTTYHTVINLLGGTNLFSATAVNKDKIESDAVTSELFSDHADKSSTCYLLAVGINQYKNPRMELNYARPDAESFAKLVGERGTALFKGLEVHTIYDTEASRENILRKLDELAQKVHPEDVFIFYYAGHGSMVDDQFFFIPTESLRLYDLSSLKKEAIHAGFLQEKLRNIHALKQLIIMDACQSGGSVELLATRGAAEEKAIAQLSRSAGIHVMASAGSEQLAAEFSELGHGLFTYLLIKALSGDADGAPKDGKVTIYELKSYLDDQVPEMTRKLKGKPQYPYTFSRGQDFPVVMDH